jgi:two-component system, LytTR family, response regulator
MEPLRAYLVDDEPLALKRLTRLLNANGRVRIVGATTSPLDAIDFLSVNSVDILFLDIHMMTMDGFELLAHLRQTPRVIFTTAYDQYAVKAFAVNAVDYLLKPIDPSQLERSLLRISKPEENTYSNKSEQLASEKTARSNRELKVSLTNRIWSKSGDKISLIDLKDVSHFYSQDKVTYAATDARHYIVDFSITALEGMLVEFDFVRIHRGTLLNLLYLDELHRWFGGGLIARLKDGKQTKLTVARGYAKMLKERLGII